MPVFEKLKEPIDSALEDSGFDTDEITDVLLVGGSSRIPWIKNWLRDYFG